MTRLAQRPRVAHSEGRPTEGPSRRGHRGELGQTLLRARVLLSSYAPLNAILFARIDTNPRWIFLGLAIAGLVDAYRLTWDAQRLAATPRVFSSIRDSGGEIAGYVATYLLPFLAAPHPDTGDLWAYGIYALVVAVITLRSDLGHVNPTIYMLGWRVVTVTLEDGRERYLVCRAAPKAGESVRVSELYGILHAKN